MSILAKINDVYAKSSCLFTQEQVEAALDKMAMEIKKVLHDKNPIILGVMVGALVPMGRLLLNFDFPLEIDYVHATRYTGDIKASDELLWKAKPSLSVKGRTVLVFDDILDGGLTLASIIQSLREDGAAEIYSAVLVDKHHKRMENGLEKADFVGLEVDDHYIFGYGLDYNEYLRNAPGIYVVAPEHE